MTGFRAYATDHVDPSRILRFTFDGQVHSAWAGDTIASALLAAGVMVVGRSFKYHRPRGVWGKGAEEPNAIVDVGGSRHLLNARATTQNVVDGMVVRSVNTSPSARNDRNAYLDTFSRFIPAAFYYKTFMWPKWELFEPGIRRMAGLGALDPSRSGPRRSEQINETCNVLVVGAGPAGLHVALQAAQAGRSVILCDEDTVMGGSLLYRSARIDGQDGARWVADALARLRDLGAVVLPRTTAFGVYDHALVALNERSADDRPDRLWRVRPDRLVLTTGAIERPLPFSANDLPGVMSAEAALSYLRRFGVAVGRKVVVASNNGLCAEVADALRAAGADVTSIDYRSGARIVAARGGKAVTGVEFGDGSTLEADALVVSGGFTPTLHLFCQARGKLRWDEALKTFVPGDSLQNVAVAGAAAGSFDLEAVFASAAEALSSIGIGQAGIPRCEGVRQELDIAAAWPRPGMKGRVWVDLQHDVTAKDIELAARENFVSVEHLKRYTTLGMAPDQGKTSNLNGIALMANLTGRDIPQVGTTTYRPPFTPVAMTSLAGMRGGALMNPPRRLSLENEHRDDGAHLREYGGWLRPAWYGAGRDHDAEQDAVQREARQARETVALFDGSSLGKIEVQGPDAASFMDFIYYNTMSTLRPGRCRYGFILRESGVVYDDGVLVRLDDNRFIVSCSSSHVAGVHALLQEWRQDRFDRSRLFVHDATAESATLTVSGPRSKALIETLDLGLRLDDEALPHMATAWGVFAETPVRVTRVSFTGDRSYELSIRADRALPLWRRLKQNGEPMEAVLLGVEALMILRAEKGFIVIGKDSDGMTYPMDLGATAPRSKKSADFVGRRSLFTEEASRQDRKQLVGLDVVDGRGPFATGAHGVEREAGKARSLGYVTSSYFSPTLRKPIALALIERGVSREGDVIDVQHLGEIRKGRIIPACALDPQGERLNA